MFVLVDVDLGMFWYKLYDCVWLYAYVIVFDAHVVYMYVVCCVLDVIKTRVHSQARVEKLPASAFIAREVRLIRQNLSHVIWTTNITQQHTQQESTRIEETLKR